MFTVAGERHLNVVAPVLEGTQWVSSKDCLEKFFLKLWSWHLNQGWMLRCLDQGASHNQHDPNTGIQRESEAPLKLCTLMEDQAFSSQ